MSTVTRAPSSGTTTATAAEVARFALLAFFEDVLNQRRVPEMDRIFDDDVVYHSAGAPDMTGLPVLRQWVADYLKAVPDYHARVEDVFAADDRAVLRWSCTGTHRGPLMGLPASGRRFTLTGITIFRVRDGRVVEAWVERDALGLSRQLAPS